MDSDRLGQHFPDGKSSAPQGEQQLQKALSALIITNIKEGF